MAVDIAFRKHQMSRARIVIAEDNLLVQELIRMHVITAFEVVATVEDGHAAVDVVGRLHPDVLLLDGSLPSMNGFAVARLVKQTWPDTKIIFVSAESDESYKDAALRAGASAYVLKSRIITELIPAITGALAESFSPLRSVRESGAAQ